MDVFLHDEAVYGLSINPANDDVFASACDDGQILIHDMRLSSSEGLCQFSKDIYVTVNLHNQSFRVMTETGLPLINDK